jgi:outer membrane biosynthesis protein TonB
MTDQPGRPLLASIGLHLAVFLLVVFGLPQFSDDVIMAAAPIPVEVISPDQVSSAPPKLRVAQNQAKPPPEPVVTPPPPPPPPVPDEIPIPQKEPPKKEPPKKEPPKVEPPKKEPPKKQTEKKPDRPKPPKKDTQFTSLLDKLADEADPKPPQEGVAESPVEESPNLSSVLNASELDAVREQVMGCWLEPTGLREGEKLVVEVQVQVNQDRTVRTAKVLDRARMSADPFYRTLAESAVRAMYNPRCSPLMLPPDKYSTWKTITFRFAPGNIY